MSYCRFSCDDFKSDVYVYEHYLGGFVIHVAGSRVVGDVPKLPKLTEDNHTEFLAACHARSEFMRTAKRESIELPHAGETFSPDTASDCIARLIELRDMGYHVPQHALDQMAAESVPPADERR